MSGRHRGSRDRGSSSSRGGRGNSDSRGGHGSERGRGRGNHSGDQQRQLFPNPCSLCGRYDHQTADCYQNPQNQGSASRGNRGSRGGRGGDRGRGSQRGRGGGPSNDNQQPQPNDQCAKCSAFGHQASECLGVLPEHQASDPGAEQHQEANAEQPGNQQAFIVLEDEEYEEEEEEQLEASDITDVIWREPGQPAAFILSKKFYLGPQPRRRRTWDWGGLYENTRNGHPYAWSWTTLFQMYTVTMDVAPEVSGGIFEVIQIKRCQKTPMRYNFPDAACKIIYGNSKLRNSPVAQMLNVWRKQNPINRREGDAGHQHKYPSWFTGIDPKLEARQEEAAACKKCHSTNEHVVCDSATHTKEDEKMDLRHVWCRWHDPRLELQHGKCLERFDVMDANGRFRDPPPPRKIEEVKTPIPREVEEVGPPEPKKVELVEKREINPVPSGSSRRDDRIGGGQDEEEL